MTTGQIYWGAVPFVLIQLIMVALIIAFPGLVSGGLAKKAAVEHRQMQIEVPSRGASRRQARRSKANQKTPAEQDISEGLTSSAGARCAARCADTMKLS